jgi:DNA-binding MarR family transcriptional regulator
MYSDAPMTRTTSVAPARPAARPSGAGSPAFLLAQVGSHAAATFAERLSALDLTPAYAGTLRLLGLHEGITQRALGARLRIQPSRLVALLDDLEERGLVERRDHPDDRRRYALYLTNKGRSALKAIGHIAREHQDALCAALSEKERAQLGSFLRRIAEEQGLTPGVHPGFSRMK